mgnify:CR=1 FL=1
MKSRKHKNIKKYNVEEFNVMQVRESIRKRKEEEKIGLEKFRKSVEKEEKDGMER